MNKNGKTILVTGATGKQGGAVAWRLAEDGWKVRALTRRSGSDAARTLAKAGMEVVEGDLNIPATVEPALRGAYGVFSVQNTWEHGVEKEIKQGTVLADMAKQAGIQHFVYSSVGCAQCRTGIPHFDSKWEIEKHIQKSGLHSTIFRPAFFMENLESPQVAEGLSAGHVSLALPPDKPLQMIAVDDIGAFVALAFNDPQKYLGKALDISGDELTGPQMAQIFSLVLHKLIIFQELPLDRLRSASADYALMFEWFRRKGFEADLKILRKIHPGLQRFEQWASGVGWGEKQEHLMAASA